MKAIKVLLADDHVLIRAGVRALLQPRAGLEVVAEASDGLEALAMAQSFRPDVVLMDVAMPGLNGLEVAAKLTSLLPETRCIILTMHHDQEYVYQALRAGAAGYMLKDSSPGELEMAIRAVAKGESYLSPVVSRHVISDYIRMTGSEEGSKELLTPRQREVLQWIAAGETTKSIARKLGLSIKTVETHRSQLMERLGIHEVAGLVRYAIRVGLIKPDK